MGITAENVHAAADRIAEAGQQPTLAAVRAALGGGSFTTISGSMKAWKAARQSTAIPMLQEAPQAVTDRLTALGGEVWALALGMANDRLAKEREALEASRQEVEAQRREAAELADQMSFELEAARAQIDQQADALRRAQEQASQLAVAQAVLAEVQKRADGLAALVEQERNATQIAQAKAEAAIAEAANLAGKLSVSQVPKSQTKKSSAP
jgi:chromosome segregation ATPase